MGSMCCISKKLAFNHKTIGNEIYYSLKFCEHVSGRSNMEGKLSLSDVMIHVITIYGIKPRYRCR